MTRPSSPSPGCSANEIRLRQVVKKFGATDALAELDMDFSIGCRLVLVGGSGAGKTTLLRAIAGLEPLDHGSIHFGSEDLTSAPPHRRNVALLGQDYAIYPHLTLERNLLTALEPLRLTAQECSSRIEDALLWFDLTSLRARRPAQLSGGQLQRAALAKAIVRRPRLLLLDEPLSQLDPSLREQSRSMILAMAKRYGITLILVTHDPLDALRIAEKIAVMDQGKIVQMGSPEQLYCRPRSRMVAELLSPLGLNVIAGAEGPLYFRPESVQVAKAGLLAEVDQDRLMLTGQLIGHQFLGFSKLALVQLDSSVTGHSSGAPHSPIKALCPVDTVLVPGPVQCDLDRNTVFQFAQ